MSGEAGLSCPQCSAARDIYRYCMNCGFDYADLPDDPEPAVALDGDDASQPTRDTDAESARTDEVVEADTAERPAVSIQPVLPPPPSGEEQSRIVGGRSAPILLGLIVAAVFVLILIVATIVSLIGSDGESPDTTASDSSARMTHLANATSSDETMPTCWDGTQVTTLSECPEPTGTAGLAWVFPSFDQQECNKLRTDPAKWTCTVVTPDGGEVRVRYREHRSVQRPLAAYSAKYGGKNRTAVLSAREDVERYVWRSPRPNNNGVWVVSSMYAEHPWSVTLKGRSADDVQTAFTEYVEFRNPRRLSGTQPRGDTSTAAARYTHRVIFKRVGEGRPYPDHQLSSKEWATVPPRQVRLDQLVTTHDNLQLALCWQTTRRSTATCLPMLCSGAVSSTWRRECIVRCAPPSSSALFCTLASTRSQTRRPARRETG